MRLLVTGCAGFIGAEVARVLLTRGESVIGVDNLNSAYDVRLKKWRLAQLEGIPGFEFHHLDITDRNGLHGLFQRCFDASGRSKRETDSGLEAVINLAARAGVRQSVENPWVYLETNVTGTLNLLELCRKFGVRKFVLASTSSLYGAHNPLPFREDADTDGPLSPYAASKKAAEALCYTYHYLFGIDVTVLRYFTVYGPAGRPDMSLFRFVQWISEGHPVVIYGDGNQSRDFTYIDDIARGTVAGLKPVGYKAVNLGSDTPVVLIKAVRLIEQLLSKKARIEFRPPHPADMFATWADIERAKSLLDWQPRLTLEEGVQRLVSWHLENQPWVRGIITLSRVEGANA